VKKIEMKHAHSNVSLLLRISGNLQMIDFLEENFGRKALDKKRGECYTSLN